MSITTGTALLGAAGIAGAYLAFDHFQNKSNPELAAATGSKSTVESLLEIPDAAAAALKGAITPASARSTSASVADVPTVKVGMPTLANGYNPPQCIDSANTSNNNMMGISALAREILCNNVGSGDVAATFASCEVQNGNLANNCYNCSLFNIHWRTGEPYPRVRIGSEIMPSFRTGRPSDVEGFKEAIRHFKAFLERRTPHGPQALAAIRAGDFNAFQVAIGQMNYSPGYTNTVVGGQIRPGHDFMRQRYNRLRAAGLL